MSEHNSENSGAAGEPVGSEMCDDGVPIESSTLSTVVQNFLIVEIGEGDKKRDEDVKVPIGRIASDIERCTTGIMSLKGNLFVVAERRGLKSIQHIETAAALEAWVEAQCVVNWTSRQVFGSDLRSRVTPISWANIKEHLRMAAPCFSAIATLPHYPARPDTFYLHAVADYNVADADGSVLEAFVDLFNPDSDADRDLIKALVVTPFWGGHPGTIPLFVASSDHGVGVGKSSTIEAIGDVCGGCIATEKNDTAYELAVRMGSEPARRLMLIDNVKGRQDSSKWEAMITAKEVSLRRLNRGSFMVPNGWVWAMTANLCDLSTDLASRAVVIKIGRRQHTRDFKTEVAEFLAEKREALIADILAYLAGDARCEITSPSRWQAWERAVLARMPNGDELARLIEQRRAGVDSDTDDAEEARYAIAAFLSGAGWDAERHNVMIATSLLLEPMRELTGRAYLNAQQMWAYLEPLLRTKPLNHCEKTRKQVAGKQVTGLLWSVRPSERVHRWDETPPYEGENSGGNSNVVGFPTRPSCAPDEDEDPDEAYQQMRDLMDF